MTGKPQEQSWGPARRWEGGDEAEDSCSEPLEFDDGRAGTCALAVVPGIATGLGGGRGESSVSAAVPGGGSPVVVLGEDGGVVVLDGCCSRAQRRAGPGPLDCSCGLPVEESPTRSSERSWSGASR